MRVLTDSNQITTAWLSEKLSQVVTQLMLHTEASNWASQVRLQATLDDGTTRALRLKLCLGETFGSSEVEFYTCDYATLADAPLVRCYDAQFESGVGYHILLDDLSETHHDRKEAPPTLEYGLAVAEALGRLHRHHAGSQPVPDDSVWERYFAEIRPGVLPMEEATGQAFAERFEHHAQALRTRWSDPQGQSLLHGDLNSSNILTPKDSESPVYFLERQPFDWSLTYGLAAYDLAYFLILWWPEEIRQAHEAEIVRRWWEAFAQAGYSWEQALSDWKLSVEQCLHVPLEWCSKPKTVETMRWLWSFQLARVQAAQSLS